MQGYLVRFVKKMIGNDFSDYFVMQRNIHEVSFPYNWTDRQVCVRNEASWNFYRIFIPICDTFQGCLSKEIGFQTEVMHKLQASFFLLKLEINPLIPNT